MNLEEFPYSKSANRMISYLTEGFYDRSYIGKWIFEVMGQEWDQMLEIFDTFQEQCFPKTCTWSLQYFEQMFGLESKGNFEERKIALLKKISVVLPFNQCNIKKSIQAISNVISEKIQVIEYPEEFRFEVKILADDEIHTNWKLIREYLYKIKPAHLLLLFVVVSVYSFYTECLIETNILQVRSEISMLRHLLLNGDKKLDGVCCLDGKRKSDSDGCIVSKIILDSYINIKESLDSYLRVEKDLWHLDGDMCLDGTRLLDAEIQEITL